MVGFSSLGYVLAELLPLPLAAALVFFTPAFFLVSLLSGIRWRFEYVALLLGAVGLVAVLVFLVPIPGFIRAQVAIPLQTATAVATQAILEVFGMPIERAGNEPSGETLAFELRRDLRVDEHEGAAGLGLVAFALLSALEQWPVQGIPANPGAWLMAAAKHRAIDYFRRNKLLERKHEELSYELEAGRERSGRSLDAEVDRLVAAGASVVVPRQAML